MEDDILKEIAKKIEMLKSQKSEINDELSRLVRMKKIYVQKEGEGKLNISLNTSKKKMKVRCENTNTFFHSYAYTHINENQEVWKSVFDNMSNFGSVFENVISNEIQKNVLGLGKTSDVVATVARNALISVNTVGENSAKTVKNININPIVILSGNRTIKEDVLDILSFCKRGMEASEILKKLRILKNRKSLMRSSLSPQLSRLKQEGKLEYYDKKWILPEYLHIKGGYIGGNNELE